MALSVEEFVQRLFDLDDECPISAEECDEILAEAGIDKGAALAAAMKLCDIE